MFQLFFLDVHSQDRLPLCPLAGGVVPASGGRHMRSPLPEDTVVRGPLSDAIPTGRELCRVHDPLCALARIHPHGPHRDEAAFARKALGSAGGEVLAIAATVIAAAVTAVEAQTGAGAGIDVRQPPKMSRVAFAPLCAKSTSLCITRLASNTTARSQFWDQHEKP